MPQGTFVVFEGGEGTGKTTQIKKLVERLTNAGQKVLLTREPGGTDCLVAEKIRTILKDPVNKSMVPKAELFLFLASRAQHVEEVVKPHLERNYIVISDRYFGSTLAYQHFARGLFSLDQVKELNAFAIDDMIPDLTVLLDIHPEQGLQRITQRAADDRLDSEKLEFHHKVRDGFLSLSNSEENWVVINADQSVSRVHDDIWKQIQPKL